MTNVQGLQILSWDLYVLPFAGGTFALYSLITRYAHIATPSGAPNASDLHLSRYTSNSMVEASHRQGPKTTSERVPAQPSHTGL